MAAPRKHPDELRGRAIRMVVDASGSGVPVDVPRSERTLHPDSRAFLSRVRWLRDLLRWRRGLRRRARRPR